MVDYYRALKLNPTASGEEIKKAIRRELRVWSNRTNAPQIERRQEAERMVQILEEAEQTLLNANKRAEYNRQLQNKPAPQPSQPSFEPQQDLIQEGWQLLIHDNVADALFIATKATQQQPENPEAWALLGQAKFRWGELEDAAYEYKRAIQLRPNEDSYYFDLGTVYESAERWGEALTQYQRASQIQPGNTMYRAAIGILLIKNDAYTEGIGILKQCLQEEPSNETYKWFLAIAYAESAYEEWTYVPPEAIVPEGFYATDNKQVEAAEQLIEEAESLQVKDYELKQHIRMVRENIGSMRKRRFHGNKLAAGTALVLGVFVLFTGDPQGAGVAAYFLVCGGLYVASCMTPQYKLNLRIIQGQGVTGSEAFLSGAVGDGEDGGGCIGLIIGLVIVVTLLPIMAAWNFIKNYAIK